MDQVLKENYNTVRRRIEATPGEYHTGGELRTPLVLNTLSQVRSHHGVYRFYVFPKFLKFENFLKISDSPYVLFLPGVMTTDEHDRMVGASEELDHGFFLMHNDYRGAPKVSGWLSFFLC